MDHYLICQNPKCRFVLDRLIDGKPMDIPRLLKNCPACGSAWSSTCPFCSRTLSVTFDSGFPDSACCGHRLRAESAAAAAA